MDGLAGPRSDDDRPRAPAPRARGAPPRQRVLEGVDPALLPSLPRRQLLERRAAVAALFATGPASPARRQRGLSPGGLRRRRGRGRTRRGRAPGGARAPAEADARGPPAPEPAHARPAEPERRKGRGAVCRGRPGGVHAVPALPALGRGRGAAEPGGARAPPHVPFRARLRPDPGRVLDGERTALVAVGARGRARARRGAALPEPDRVGTGHLTVTDLAPI